jgi:hypothetical protein
MIKIQWLAHHCMRLEAGVKVGNVAAMRQGATAAISSIHVTTMTAQVRLSSENPPTPCGCNAPDHNCSTIALSIPDTCKRNGDEHGAQTNTAAAVLIVDATTLSPTDKQRAMFRPPDAGEEADGQAT